MAYWDKYLQLLRNLLGLITGANVRDGKEKRLFSTPFSQYVRSEIDFRHYLVLGATNKERINQIASRIILGAGYGYGNNTTMPFIKSFFVGGTNSIRAFRARSLGPGTFYGNNASFSNTFLPDQPG